MENISTKTIELLNLRIKNEELSSRIYRQMYVELDYYGYSGAAKLWKKYSDEELGHAQMVYDLLLDLDVLPTVPELKAPTSYNGDLPAIIKASYEHEQQITRECQQLYLETLKSGDILAMQLAQKLVTEQVEELAKSKYWVDKLEQFGDDKIALRLLDNEMGELA